MPLIEKIVSGGQTGADRAALDWAIENGVPHGGWCPRGRLAEDGPISARYLLTETPSSIPLQCNEWSVWDAEGVVVISMDGQLSEYCHNTIKFADKHRKPFLHVQAEPKSAVKQLRDFVEKHRICKLNIVCCQTLELEEMSCLLPLILTDAFSPSFAQPSEGGRQSSGTVVANPSLATATVGLVPDNISSEDFDDASFESQCLAMYRSWEGKKEYAEKVQPMFCSSGSCQDTDTFHVTSAMASLTQSNPAEAARHLEQISEGIREHPVVIHFFLYVYLATKNWPKLAEVGEKYSQWRPEDRYGWAFWAIALDKMGLTKEAYTLLMSVLERFPTDFVFPYNLACFACRLGQQEEAWAWVQKAFCLTTLEKFKLWLSSDDDLEPLREKILQLSQTRLI